MNWVCLHGLWDKPEYVPYRITIICGNPTFSGKNFVSLGYPVLHHLAADGAGLPGGRVAVIAALQVDTNLLSSLHLELVYGFLSLGNIDPVVKGLVIILHQAS